MTRSTTRRMLTPSATAQMLGALQRAPQSLNDLVALTDLAKPTVTRYVNELHAANLAHVAGWERDTRGYPTIRQFAWGNQCDAPCPKTDRTSTSRMRDLRAARKAGAA